jgi:hypothetical protein
MATPKHSSSSPSHVEVIIDVSGMSPIIDSSQGNEQLILSFHVDEMPTLLSQEVGKYLEYNGWTSDEIEQLAERLFHTVRREMVIHELKLRVK